MKKRKRRRQQTDVANEKSYVAFAVTRGLIRASKKKTKQTSGTMRVEASFSQDPG